MIEIVIYYYFNNLLKDFEKLNKFELIKLILYIIAKYDIIKLMRFSNMKMIDLFREI